MFTTRAKVVGFVLLLAVGLAVLPRMTTSAAETATATAPDIVRAGLDAFRLYGAEVAVQNWLRQSVLENSPDMAGPMSALAQAQALYGRYTGYHMILDKALTPTTRVVYLSVDLERGPVFGRIVAYDGKFGWVVTELSFDTQLENIVPKEYIFK